MDLTNKIVIFSRINDSRLKHRISCSIEKHLYDLECKPFLTNLLAQDYKSNLNYLKKHMIEYQESLNELLDQGYEFLKEDLDYSFSMKDLDLKQKCLFMHSWLIDHALYENKILAKRCPFGSDKSTIR